MKKLIPILLIALLLSGCATQTPVAPVSSQSSPKDTPTTTVEETSRNIITEDEAIKIAMEHAGLNTGAVKSSSVQLDMSEEEYEVEFFAKGIEYEYEINAYTGEIITAEKDKD